MKTGPERSAAKAATDAPRPPELERQMKMENLFVTWQQRSAPASMPISVSSPSVSSSKVPGPSLATVPVLTALCLQAGELETLKQSSRLVHYCATALLFDPAAWLHGPPETSAPSEGQVRLKLSQSSLPFTPPGKSLDKEP